MNREEIFDIINSTVRVYHDDGWVYVKIPCGQFKTRHAPLLYELKRQLDQALNGLLDHMFTERGAVWLDMLCDGSEPPQVYDIHGNTIGGIDEEVPENRSSDKVQDSRPD